MRVGYSYTVDATPVSGIAPSGQKALTMTMTIAMWKERSTDYTSWHVDVNGVEFCEITKECQTYAHGTSRARGTKVEGYWVQFADRRESVWFDATVFRTARRALKAATNFARAKALKGGQA